MSAAPGVDYRPGVVLYRIVVAAAKRAERRAHAHIETESGERRLREIDACIETIVLTQGALEAAINGTLDACSIKPPDGSWVDRWAEGPRLVAIRRRRPEGSPFDPQLVAELRDLSAWRQFFLHNDTKSRQRFADTIGHPVESIPEHCTAALAAHWIEVADRVFTWGSGVTGDFVPTSDFLWIALEEL